MYKLVTCRTSTHLLHLNSSILLASLSSGLSVRNLTTSEASTALRPFYFAVHPDLFGQYPLQRAINENSLKQLSSILETLQNKGYLKPISLPFYLKEKDNEGIFRYVKIFLQSGDLRQTVLVILKTCNLPTDYIDKIPEEKKPSHKYENVKINVENMDFSKINENDPIFGQFVMKQKIKEAQDSFKLQNWLRKNTEKAKLLREKSRPLTEEVRKLQEIISKEFQLLDIRWNCGWNETHYRGCLMSFISLAEQHPEPMKVLKESLCSKLWQANMKGTCSK